MLVAVLACAACGGDDDASVDDAAVGSDVGPAGDSGTPPVDAGPAGFDAGEVGVDAGELGVDAGALVFDAGGLDAGSVERDAGASSLDAGARVDGGPTRADAGPPPSESCACEAGSRCDETSGAECPAFLSLCRGRRATSCRRDGALYTCRRSDSEATFYYDYTSSESLERSCAEQGATFITTPPRPPIGAPCSCQRNASLCIETYGTACESLSCNPPAIESDGACAIDGALPGRCVSLNGQRRVAFYGLSRTEAESACRDLSGDWYWVP